MSTTHRFAGTCFIKVDGVQLQVEGSVETPLLKYQRETKVSTSGVVGYSETPVTPYVKVTAYTDPDFPLETLRDNDNMTVTAEMANGFVYTLQGAWLAGETAINNSDATVSLTFEGISGIWQTA